MLQLKLSQLVGRQQRIDGVVSLRCLRSGSFEFAAVLRIQTFRMRDGAMIYT